MKKDDEIVTGLVHIGRIIGIDDRKTLLKHIRTYPSIPIRKMLGQWTTHRSELCNWWAHYCTGQLDHYKPLSRGNNGGIWGNMGK